MRNLSKNTDLSCKTILEESIYTKSKMVLNMLKLYLLRDKARSRFCLFVLMLYVPSNDFQSRTKAEDTMSCSRTQRSASSESRTTALVMKQRATRCYIHLPPPSYIAHGLGNSSLIIINRIIRHILV